MFTLFVEEIGGAETASVQGVCMNHILFLEDLVQVSIILYDLEFVDRAMIEELARRNVDKHSNTVPLLRYNCQICYVSNINALF